MRKIDKSKILSVVYKEWVDELDENKEVHPKAKESIRTDILMNLLHCQKGLCAYTEIGLCSPELLTEDKWKNGCYKVKSPERFGELEHFNPDLKTEKCYEWDNLFVVFADINRRKSKRPVDDILKPDTPIYNPVELLEYDIDTHRFVPNQGIESEEIKARIKQMIGTLQINHDTVCYKRKDYLIKAREYLDLKGNFKVTEFFTACKMAGIPVEDN